MAGRPRQPVDLLLAKGRSHLTEAEIEERRAREVKVPFDDVQPPEYLKGEKMREEFMEIAGKLKAIGIFTELDEDALARYILSRSLYLQYTAKLPKLIARDDVEEIGKYQRWQNTAFMQCSRAASELGLNITSRCRIQVPQVDSDDDYEL